MGPYYILHVHYLRTLYIGGGNLKKVLNLLWSLVKSAFLPIIKTLLLVFEVIFEAFNYENKIVKKILTKYQKN